jgi:hypothetical protein
MFATGYLQIGWDGAVAIFLSSYYCYLRLPPKNYEIYAINNFDWMKSVIIVEEAGLTVTDCIL